MLRSSSEYTMVCERLLANELADLALELRQLDAADLAAWIHGNRYGNVAAIVASACELSHEPGALRFSLSGHVDLQWKGSFEVRLDMEFHHAGVDCYFELHIADASAGVNIVFMSVDGAICRSPQCVEKFATALASARIDDARRGVVGGGLRKPDANESH